MKKSRKTKKENVVQNKLDLAPLVILFGVLPWIAHLKVVEMPLTQYAWFPQKGTQYDFFLYWKSILFLILVVWMLVNLIDRIVLRGERQFEWKRFLPLAGYALFIILSAFLSENQYFSIHGIWEQYETVWVLSGYIVAVFYASQIALTKKNIKILLAALFFGAFIQAILGIFQFFGQDFFESGVGKSLLLSGADEVLRDGLNFTFSNSRTNRVYMASHNPNYAGVYIVMVLPVVVLTIWKAKMLAVRIGAAILSGALFLCLWGCGSKAGFFTVIFLIFVGAFLLIGDRKRRSVFLIVCVIITIFLGAGYEKISGGSISNALKKSFRKIDKYKMEALIPHKDAVQLNYRGHIIQVSVTEKSGKVRPRVCDETGKTIKKQWKEKKQRWVLRDPDFYDIGFNAWRQNGADILVIYCNRSQFTFVKRGESAYMYVNVYGKADTIENAPSAVFDGYEKAFSGRGYIWGRCFPIAAKHLLIGSGPDTFAVTFPQNDYLMRANTGPAMYLQIVSKPHNMYLQSTILTGGFSLICLLGFWGVYIKNFIKSWNKERKRQIIENVKTERCQNNIIACGIFLGVCGYLLMGLLNDSTVAVAPVFWGLLGLGIALESGVQETRGI